jgi:HEAT repeats
MRRTSLLCAAIAFAATAANGSTQLPLPIQNALTPIDTVPTPDQLDTVFVGHQSALQNLSMIAGDDGTNVGIRLRAIHALSKYCVSPCADTDMAHQALTAIISANAGEQTGAGVVMLRGAVEALGPQRVGTDLPLLVPLLDHTSRDVRTAAAHALRDLCNTQAINPLRVRYQHEATDQVRLAISEALRILGQGPCQ